MATRRTTWGKAEKLKSRKRIERVFREGKSFSMFPYKVVFLVGPATASIPATEIPPAPSGAPPAPGGTPAVPGATQAAPSGTPPAPSGTPAAISATPAAPGATAPPAGRFSPLQAGFGASSRNFKKAVDRNRIKRLSREAYRLQKAPLLEQLTQKGLSMAVFFVFIGKELPAYATVSARIGVALQKLLKETA